MLEDISYRKSLEDQLRQSQKTDALGTLAGGIAHDFNNILGAIIGFSELAAAKIPPGSPVQEDLAQVLTASHRAKELVGQILAFSRQSRIENRLDIPVILSTGYSKIASEARARELGIRAYVQKPILTADLADTVRQVLGEPETH